MKNSLTPADEKQPPMEFEIFFKENGDYHFQLKDEAGRPFFFSKSYETEESCLTGIQTTIRAVGKKERFSIKNTKKGKFYFTLKFGNKQIGRSGLADDQETLEKQLQLMTMIDEEIPVRRLTDKQKSTEDSEKTYFPTVPETPAVREQTESEITPPEDIDKNARYHFSIIYYPDSRVWKIVHDLSGNSEKMPTCDGPKIARFLQAQLPAAERQPVQRAVAAPKARISKEKSAPVVSIPHQKTSIGEMEVIMRTPQGQPLQGFAKLGSAGKIELIPQTTPSKHQISYNGKVIAKRLEDHQSVVIGDIRQQVSVNGRLEVPIPNMRNLYKGTYKITADIQSTEAEHPAVYRGRNSLVIQ